MDAFISEKIGRTFILRLVEDEDVLECVEKLIEEQHIENAVVVSGIATFKTLAMHNITTTGYPAAFHETDLDPHPIEVGSIDGTIVDGEPHLHFTGGDKDRAYCGHLRKGNKALYLCEIVIMELLGLSIERKPTPKGLKQIEVK